MEREDFGNQIRLNRLFNGRSIGTIIVTAAVSSLLTLGGLALNNQVRPAPIYIESPLPTPTLGPTATPEPITIFVNGQVAKPEIYVLPHDAIVQDAIIAAGGFTSDAFQDIVNMAQPLQDGMQVYVPARTEADTAAVPLVSLAPVNASAGGGDNAPSQGELVDINNASKSELETLPGVGPSTAQKILDFREDNGPFTLIDDIMNVSGIGPAKFEQMAPFITAN